MPTPLIPITLQNPGHRGLNTQDSTWVSSQGWASELFNAVFDNTNRATSRKGWSKLTTSSTFGAYDLEQVHCFEDGTNTVVISAGNDDLFYGTTTLTSIKGALTPTADNWQFGNWNDGTNTKVLAWQQGKAPIVSTVTGGTPGNFAAIVASSGSVPQGNCMITAFGRVWATASNKTSLMYSGLLNETQWASGGAGTLDTSLYWPRGMDFITAISAWEDKIVVFGRKSILIYGSPEVIANIALLDTIEGVGCVARDSVQVVGKDIFFLSETGLRSLRRTVETERNPLQEVGAQVRDELVPYISSNEALIRSCYNQEEGFYLLSIPDTSDHVCFMYDMKALSNRDALGRTILDIENTRVSVWRGWEATGLAYGNNRIMYGAFRDSTDSNEGVIGKYSGYLDNTSTYVFSYFSPWIDLSQDTTGAIENTQGNGYGLGAFLKIPKSIQFHTVGGAGYTVTAKWSYDYSPIYFSESFIIPGAGNETSEYGESEYGIAEWGFSSSRLLTQSKANSSSHGQTFRVGFSVSIDGDLMAIQRIDTFCKKGRLAR